MESTESDEPFASETVGAGSSAVPLPIVRSLLNASDELVTAKTGPGNAASAEE